MAVHRISNKLAQILLVTAEKLLSFSSALDSKESGKKWF